MKFDSKKNVFCWLSFFCLALIASGCDFFSSRRVNLTQEDLVTAQSVFEEALLNKIELEGAVANEIKIEQASLNPNDSRQVFVTYTVVYTFEGTATSSPMEVIYRGASTLQASRPSKDEELHWNVVESKQLDYSMNFLESNLTQKKL